MFEAKIPHRLSHDMPPQRQRPHKGERAVMIRGTSVEQPARVTHAGLGLRRGDR